MTSMKQFLLSILATTVSIALTFGTAAIIDNNKKRSEKRAIVMMVMYDMAGSLQSVDRADSMLHESMLLQRQIATDASKFDSLKYQMIHLTPRIDFTETTERIFSSTIETINTVGNVLFTESVAKFYQARNNYKTTVCDSIANRIILQNPIADIETMLDFDYIFDALMSVEIRQEMHSLFAQCKQMMHVTDEEIDSYRKEREKIREGISDDIEETDSVMKTLMLLQNEIDDAKKHLSD